jgi:hypothetical protein
MKAGPKAAVDPTVFPWPPIGYDTSDLMKNQSHDCRARDTLTVC